jgi:hypothetical protein
LIGFLAVTGISVGNVRAKCLFHDLAGRHRSLPVEFYDFYNYSSALLVRATVLSFKQK